MAQVIQRVVFYPQLVDPLQAIVSVALAQVDWYPVYADLPERRVLIQTITYIDPLRDFMDNMDWLPTYPAPYIPVKITQGVVSFVFIQAQGIAPPVISQII